MQTALTVIHILISIILILFVLLQESKEGGLSSTFMGGQEDSNRAKPKTLNSILSKWTVIVGVLFVITTLGINYVINK